MIALWVETQSTLADRSLVWILDLEEVFVLQLAKVAVDAMIAVDGLSGHYSASHPRHSATKLIRTKTKRK